MSRYAVSVVVAIRFASVAAVAAEGVKPGIEPIPQSEWHADMDAIAGFHKSYRDAKRLGDSDTIEFALTTVEVMLSIRSKASQLFNDIAKALRDDAFKDLEAFVTEAKKTRKAPDGKEAINAKVEKFKAAAALANKEMMHLWLVTAYAYELFPPPAQSAAKRHSEERKNLLNLQKMWSEPEHRFAIQQSWDNLIAEAKALNAPEFTFPIKE